MMLGAMVRPHDVVQSFYSMNQPVPIKGLSSLHSMKGIKEPDLNDPAPFGISFSIPSLPTFD